MTQNEMRTKLLLNDGIGVEVKYNENTFYYFYENFEGDDGITRAYKHFNHGEKLTFYSAHWAKQSQFKEYMNLFNTMEPNTERYTKYVTFLVKQLTEWSTLDAQTAEKQIVTNQISYLSFI